VQIKVLVQAVKRNLTRFPEDVTFQLTAAEFAALRSQTVTSNAGGRRTAPYAFTEQGVAMLSSVLGSARAIAVIWPSGSPSSKTRPRRWRATRHLQPQYPQSAQTGLRCAARTHDTA